MEKRMLNFEEAGILVGCSPHTLRVWVRQGLITHFRLGRRIVFRPQDLTAFVEARRVVADDSGANSTTGDRRECPGEPQPRIEEPKVAEKESQ